MSESTNVTTYDFRRPRKIHEAQKKTLAVIAENNARLVAVSLSKTFHTFSSVSYETMREETYGEFIAGAKQGGIFTRLSMTDDDRPALFYFDVPLTTAIVEHLFGNKNVPVASTTREVTAVEKRVCARVARVLAKNVGETWADVFPFTAHVTDMEGNATYAQYVHPNDMVLSMVFALTIGDVEGKMTFCLPYITLEPALPKLSPAYWYSLQQGHADNPFALMRSLTNDKLPMRIRAKGPTLTFKEISTLTKGATLKLDAFTTQPTLTLSSQEHAITLFDIDEAALLDADIPIILRDPVYRDYYAKAYDEERHEGHVHFDEHALEERVSSALRERYEGEIAHLHSHINDLEARLSATPALTVEMTDASDTHFSIDDIATLDDTTIQHILREMSPETLATALLRAEDDVRNAVFRNMSSRAGRLLREDIEKHAKTDAGNDDAIAKAHETLTETGARVIEALRAPFAFVTDETKDAFASVIAAENPQTIACLLAHLNAKVAGYVLSHMPEATRSDIAFRITRLSYVSEETLHDAEEVLAPLFAQKLHEMRNTQGGVDALASVLNAMDRKEERAIVHALEERDDALAEEVKDRMFVFEDIVLLDDASIQKVLAEVEAQNLAKALKTVDDTVTNAIYRNLAKDEATGVRKMLDSMTTCKAEEVELAQKGIVAIIRRLDDANEIAFR